jgi:hypothetical protein
MWFRKRKRLLIDYDVNELRLHLQATLQASLLDKLIAVNEAMALRYASLSQFDDGLPMGQERRDQHRRAAKDLRALNATLQQALPIALDRSGCSKSAPLLLEHPLPL